MLIMGGLQSCTAMFGSAGTGVAATSYLSEDSDMLGAEAAYADMEADLQYELATKIGSEVVYFATKIGSEVVYFDKQVFNAS